MRRVWCALLPGLLLLAGCASERSAAPVATKASEPVQAERARPEGTRNKGGDADKKVDTNVYAATITEGGKDTKPFVLEQAVLFVPEVSLFGGSSGSEKKVLELRRGKATTIEIPFFRIELIQVGKQDEDRLKLTISLRGTKPEDKLLEGTVKASLQLKGIFAGKKLSASVKLRDVKTVELKVLKKKGK